MTRHYADPHKRRYWMVPGGTTIIIPRFGYGHPTLKTRDLIGPVPVSRLDAARIIRGVRANLARI